jgi:hypothetical protein
VERRQGDCAAKRLCGVRACAMVMLLCPANGWGQGNPAAAKFAGWFQQTFEARPAPPKITAEDDSTLHSQHYIKIGMVRAWMLDTASKAEAASLLQEAALKEAAKAGADLVRLDKQTFVIKVKVPTGKTKLEWSCLRETVTTVSCWKAGDPLCMGAVGDLGTKQVRFALRGASLKLLRLRKKSDAWLAMSRSGDSNQAWYSGRINNGRNGLCPTLRRNLNRKAASAGALTYVPCRPALRLCAWRRIRAPTRSKWAIWQVKR